MHVAETVHKLANKKRILVHSYISTGTDWKTRLQFEAKLEKHFLAYWLIACQFIMVIELSGVQFGLKSYA